MISLETAEGLSLRTVAAPEKLLLSTTWTNALMSLEGSMLFPNLQQCCSEYADYHGSKFEYSAATCLETEGVMIRSQKIRRYPDGSIDFDFYRKRAARQRRVTLRLTFRSWSS